jgi:glycosyltransferase involved in cell wall biosynthesis
MRVFVTREIFPFTAGGIGRVISNMLITQPPSDAPRTAVVYLGEPLDPARFTLTYPGVLLVNASPRDYAEQDGEFFYPPVECYTTSPLHAESVRAMQALKRIERERGPIEYIEFPDWGGAAFAACQEKKLGLAFQDTVIAVRLHTADSLLSRYELRVIDSSSIALYDLERKALIDCDRVVAQLGPVAEVMRAFFDIEPADWAAKLHVHAPPVLLDQGTPAERSITPQLDTPIVFSSKIQHCKRPEVFVRGVCGFLRAKPEYTGSVIFLAHAFSSEYAESVRALIPNDLKHRFTYVSNASQAERHQIIERSVCVFPTVFESFCLAAYEASLSGAVTVLNAGNPAFGDDTPWLDGQNCRKFDGFTDDLTRVLGEIFNAPTSYGVVVIPDAARPWQLPAPPQTVHTPSPAFEFPLVSVLITHCNLGRYLRQTLDSVLASDYPNLEIVVVDDASTEDVSRAVIDSLDRAKVDGLTVVRRPHNAGLSAARNLATKVAKGKYAIPLDADDLIHPAFIGLAVRALERHREFDFVVPTAGYFVDMDIARLMIEGCRDSIVFIGDARASGLMKNRFSTATMLTRRSVLTDLRYNEELTAYEDWDLYQRAIMQGRRFLVTNSLNFYYRHRPDSMNHNPAKAFREKLLWHDVLRTRSLKFGKIEIPGYIALTNAVLPGAGQSDVARIASLEAQLDEYRRSEVVFASLRIAHFLQARAPWAVSAGRRVARAMWHLVK